MIPVQAKKNKKESPPGFLFCSVPIILDKIYHRKEAKMFSFRTLWRAFLTLMGVPWQDLSPPKAENGDLDLRGPPR